MGLKGRHGLETVGVISLSMQKRHGITYPNPRRLCRRVQVIYIDFRKGNIGIVQTQLAVDRSDHFTRTTPRMRHFRLDAR